MTHRFLTYTKLSIVKSDEAHTHLSEALRYPHTGGEKENPEGLICQPDVPISSLDFRVKDFPSLYRSPGTDVQRGFALDRSESDRAKIC